MTQATARFRALLPGMLVAGFLTTVIFAGWQASRAFATDQGQPHSEPASDSSQPEQSYGKDDLGLIPYPNGLYERTLGAQEWEVWFCDVKFAYYDDVTFDFSEALQNLNGKLTPFFEQVSRRRYIPSFIEGGVVQVPNLYACLTAIEAKRKPGSQVPILIVSDDRGNSRGHHGRYELSDNGVTWLSPALASVVINHVMTVNGWLGPQLPHLGLVAHEIGHALGFPHSGGIDPYSNRMDFMSEVRRALFGTIAMNRYVAGWVDPTEITVMNRTEVTEDQFFVLSPPGEAGTQMLVIPHSSDTRGLYYTLGARTAQGYDRNLPKEGVEIYRVDYTVARHTLYYDVEPIPMSNRQEKHVLEDGDSRTVDGIEITVTKCPAEDNRFVVKLKAGPTDDQNTKNPQTTPTNTGDEEHCMEPIEMTWGASVSVLEGNPSSQADSIEWPSLPEYSATLTFSPAVREDVTLEVWPQTGPRCSHPDRRSPTWAGPADIGLTQWQADQARKIFVAKETSQITVPVWWVADWDHEPDETFCLTIRNLPNGLQWGDYTRTVLPVTLRDDDPPPQIESIPPRGVPLEELLVEDELGLIAYAEAFRQLGRDKQVWEVWICEFPDAESSYGLDFQSVSQALKEVITPYFEWLSDGHYSPSFVEGGTVLSTSSVLGDCGPEVAKQVAKVGGPQQDLPKLIIGDTNRGGGFAVIDVKRSGSGSIAGVSAAFVTGAHVVYQKPGNGLWRSPEDGKKFPPNSYILAHEMGHGLGLPHSGGLINPYSNDMDVMSGGSGRFKRLIGTIAINRYAAGWIDPEDVIIYEQGSQSYTLSPIGVDGEQMLVIPHHSGSGVFYTLGARVKPELDECNLPKEEFYEIYENGLYECNLPKEGVEVYLIDQRDRAAFRWTQPTPAWVPTDSGSDPYLPHVLGVGNSLDLGAVRVRITERTSENRFNVEVEPIAPPTPIIIKWGDPVIAPEGPGSTLDKSVKLIFSEPISQDMVLKVVPQTTAEHCTHPELPASTRWSSITDLATTRGWVIEAGTREATLDLSSPPGWNPDSYYEPDETFCLTIPNLPQNLQWEDPTRTVLPVTVLNDDPSGKEKVFVSWSDPIVAPEGDPTNEVDNVEWPSQSRVDVRLTFSRRVDRSFNLFAWFRTGAGCDHPSLEENPTWADWVDVGVEGWKQRQSAWANWVSVTEGDTEVTVPVWWTVDRDDEPDETFCIVIPNLTYYSGGILHWEDPKRTVLPVTLQNDDQLPPTSTDDEQDGADDGSNGGETPPRTTPTNPGGGGGGGGPTNTGGGGGGGGGPTNTGGGGGGGGPTNTGGDGGGGAPTGSGDDSVPVDVGCLPGNFVGVFCDEDDSVHQANIEVLASWKITLGCRENQFCPQAQISRSQMAAFLYRAVTRHAGAPPAGTAELPDVGESVWYRPFAEWSVASGVMSMVDGGFNPRQAVTRADMAEMIAAAFPDLIPQGDVTGMFTDTAGLDDATIRAMEGMFRAGVTLGCSTAPLRYCPHQPVTRAQMASFFVRVLTQPSN